MLLKRILATGCAFGLSACGGGGGAGENGFTTAVNGLDALFNEATSLSWDTTPTAALPTSTTAVYNGHAIGVSAAESYAGDLTVNAAFASNTVDGTVSGLYDSAGRPVTGSLAINPVAIDRTADPVTEFQFVSTLTGVLTDADGVVLTVNSGLDGDFIGPAAEGVGVLGSGTVTSTAYGTETFDWLGVAKR